ncbi:hypothetical protein B0H10DRAFT_2015257 [Mycena sp. CBHHK59/15]|nr:hypothetical protein B0H10DRAFT_2015257 [Mycena sp. CBHHK59/15]
MKKNDDILSGISYYIFVLITVSATNVTFASTLRAYLDPLPIQGTNFPLTHGIHNGPYVECEYNHVFASPQFCFYNATSLALTHAPNVLPVNNMTMPVDSNAACPTTLPLAGSYHINFPDTSDGFKCLTMSDDSDGAPVIIRDHNFPGPSNQVCSFIGSTIHQGNKFELQHLGGAILNQLNDIIHWLAHPDKCMDLMNGDETNGNKVLVFTSSEGEAEH